MREGIQPLRWPFRSPDGFVDSLKLVIGAACIERAAFGLAKVLPSAAGPGSMGELQGLMPGHLP